MKLEEFIKALHVACTMPEAAKCARGFVSVAEYPRGFEPEDNEFGMIVERGQIMRRLVAVS